MPNSPAPAPRLTDPSPPADLAEAAVAVRVVNQISAMLAYWDHAQRCLFANGAYLEWFGRTPEQMRGITLSALLGPDLYAKNLPYIRGALAGAKQVFERRIPLPGGKIRECIATYVPDMADGAARGFSVHVADVTVLRQREDYLARAILETVVILEQTKRSFHSKELALLRTRLEQLHASLSREAEQGRPQATP